MHGLCKELCRKKAKHFRKSMGAQGVAEVPVINCPFVSYYLPAALLCLPAGTAQPPPVHT